MQTTSIGREKASFEKGKVYGNNEKLKIIYICVYMCVYIIYNNSFQIIFRYIDTCIYNKFLGGQGWMNFC